ncbi:MULTISPECIES: GNAT family N-acetyltransferase [Arthrobacter]|uniref:GNAT family N-acetyltransferase n=2 Tax=Arthrobacter TaxID=1663 RepID=A0ABU9KIU3_9MICC|nr:GNAT family N-acetyltransferase [Arthrobacter sp. YJM1]MDP5226287.1 GNAT family N-acetyltransferase [Arthrobacter sp. YJM1]
MTAQSLRAAQADAASAAARSGVVVRELEDMRTLTAVQRLYETVWNTGPTGTPVTADFLRALAKSGNPVFGAFDGQDLVGACFGFCSPPATGNVHSHIAGVLRSAQGRSIGLALKLQQRAWAVEAGLRTMTWTFDPLIRRNAVFNLVKLGAEPVEYLNDFYGQMDDDVNRDDPSDRLLVRWYLDRPLPQRSMPGSGGPASGEQPTTAHRVAVPEDIEAMRLQDPVRAAAWRLELRRELVGRMADGARVAGFDRAGHYLLEP